MPARRSTGGNAVAGPSAPPELHPITKRLRRMWKFAAVCQFLFVFDEAFGMSGFETELLESDFESSQTEVIPDLMRRLLYTLTLDRTIDTSNWEHHVRRQYLARDPDANKYGSNDAPVPWGELSLEDKVATLHDLCEWQLQDAERFRKLVKSDDEITTWRVSPIGWDSQDNAYWLFDDNRIWIQRPEPVVKPPPAPKAKGPAKKGTKRARAEAAAAKRAAAATRSANTAAKKATRTPTRQPPRRGTRTSARFTEEDMQPETNGAAADSDSELSDPPEDPVETNTETKDEDMPDAETQEPVAAEPETPAWIEFEAIVVTRHEWQEFAKQFARSKDPNEKNLHHYIKNEVLDTVLAAMDEIDKQKALEQALANRKRSSRIAIKESEKEERERDRLARARMEEKMSMIRNEEEQKRIREEEEVQALHARENRIREREERLRAREFELENKAIREEEERERKEKERLERVRRREEIIASGGIPPPSRESTAAPDEPMSDAPTLPTGATLMAEKEDDWELNCEICGKAAINPPNEDTHIVCCEQCGVWQHVKCWNKFDKHVLNRPKKRNWAAVDFFCTKCRPPPQGVPRPFPGMVIKRREKASPSAPSIDRSSQDPESPIGKQAGQDWTRPHIKLNLGPRDSPTQILPPAPLRTEANTISVSPAPVRTEANTIPVPSAPTRTEANTIPVSSAPARTEANTIPVPSAPTRTEANTIPVRPAASQNPAMAQRPAGAQPAETGQLASSVPQRTDANAVPRAPPSSFSVPNSQPNPANMTQAVIPPHAGSHAAAAPLHREAPVMAPSSAVAGPAPPSVNMQPPVAARPSITPSGGAATSDSASSLGHGRPSSTAPQPSDSPRSPQPSLTPGANASRSPSYNGGVGSPGFRRPTQVSGSFPMRHTPMRSPLSRAHEGSLENGGDGFSLGPPRAVSPSVQRGQLPSRFGTVTMPGDSEAPPTLPPTPLHSRVPHPGPHTIGSLSSQTAQSAGMDVRAANTGIVAGTAFSNAVPGALPAVADAAPLNGGPRISHPPATGLEHIASPNSAAGNAARVLDDARSQAPHPFPDPKHAHQGSPPLLNLVPTEKPVELPPAHITPQDRT